MATKIIKMPDVGEGVAEAEIVEWHVAIGDEIREDQLLAAVMTDKATVEIPSPVAGTVLQLGGETGTVLAVGSLLVEIALDGEIKPVVVDRPEVEAKPETETKPEAAPSPVRSPVPPVAPIVMTSAAHKPLAAPAVRALAKQLHIDLSTVAGHGPDGRVTREDIAQYLAAQQAARPITEQQATEVVKIVGLRRKIAERMAKSSREVAHFSYVEEVDVTELEALRATLNKKYGHQKGKLTLLPFILRALVVALQDFPQMNAHYDDEAQTVTRYQAAHLGVATQTQAGLMVPVIQHAESLDLWGLAGTIAHLAGAAREGRASREELSGSTITVSSLGNLGGIVSTPVINQPEVAIIGVNRIAIRPQWQDNQFIPRKMMNLSSSFDHRIIDGYDAAAFIRAIKQLLEQPALLFI